MRRAVAVATCALAVAVVSPPPAGAVAVTGVTVSIDGPDTAHAGQPIEFLVHVREHAPLRQVSSVTFSFGDARSQTYSHVITPCVTPSDVAGLDSTYRFFTRYASAGHYRVRVVAETRHRACGRWLGVARTGEATGELRVLPSP